MNFLKKLKIGPAALVSAAFIGPGTVITCSIAGAIHGYTLLWALVFSIATTIVLQEMSGRIAISTGTSLSEFIQLTYEKSIFRYIISPLIIGAIWIGNAAYQSGNLTGAAMGLSSLIKDITGSDITTVLSISIVGALIFLLLFLGRYKIIERLFMVIVLLMSFIFLLTLFFIEINFSQLIAGLIIPSTPKGGFLLVIGLIGTTVVPYNLFLHSNAVKDRGWKGRDIHGFRSDLIVSILLGGFISMSILITSAASAVKDPQDLYDLSRQLSPLLGNAASAMFSFGILAAGFTSSVTAPLAAAYAVTGILKKKSDFKSLFFRITWFTVLLSGILISLSGFKPLIVIQFAQFMNGLLLPIIAILVVLIVNSPKIGKLRNSIGQNILAIIVILIVIGLGLKSIITLF